MASEMVDEPRGRAVRTRAHLCALLVVMLVLAACGGGSDDDSGGSAGEAGEPKSGGTLIYGADGEVASWQPQKLNQGTAGEDRGMYLYDTLLLVDEEGEWQPHMAESIESDDGITWTMTLREGLEFTDGTPLYAEAVKFNVELTQDPEQGSAVRNFVEDVQTMNIIDPQTVEFVLGGPDGSFPYGFTTLAGMMISPTAYEADPEGFGTKPVGAGPFMLESWVPDSKATLVRNPDYWDEGKPYLDGVEFRVLNDQVTRGQALASGEVDVAAKSAEVQAAVKDLPGFRILNENASGGIGVVMNQDTPPFDDVRIRQALALAMEPSLVNEALYQGAWEQQDLSCPPYSPDQPECLADVWPEPDLDEAKALVEEYEEENGPIEGDFEMLAPPIGEDVIEVVQQQAKEIGIDISSLRVFPVSEFIPRLQENAFDLAWIGIAPFTGPPTIAYRWLTSHEQSGWHVQGGDVDPELEDLLVEVQKGVDREDRLEAADALQQKIADEVLIGWFAPHIRGLAAKDDVVFPDRFDAGGFMGPADIWLDR